MDIYFLNREFPVNLPKRTKDSSSPDGKHPAPRPRDDEFKKTPKKSILTRPGSAPGYNPNLNPGLDYNPTDFAHGLSPGLVGSPSKYVNDQNEFMMYSSM